ncbi:MAG: UDP-glucose 4-epimerase GalE [Acidobacteriota bacterium]|nr:UDP-glucose 4-epimerase GalE [Acidobacteriota bacterium]
MGPTILVTGGAGYVGSHVCKSLAAEGFNPVAVDSLSRGHESAVKWGPLERIDLTDEVGLRAAIEQHRPTGVMHLADLCDVGESVTDPARYYHNNLVGSLNLLKGMLEQGIRSIVFSSSCAIYGVPGTLPIPETQAKVPITPYGVSKLVVEHMLRDFSVAYGIGYVCLRYFNAAGADPDGEIGESHQPETHVIPLAIEAALGERSEFEIFGTDYPTPDGTAVRDFVHVSDLAAAHVSALRYLSGGGRSAALNLGTGRGHSVKQIVAAVERLSGRAVLVKEGSRRTGDASTLVADAAQAFRVLGWTPNYTTLDDIVATAWNWHRKQLLG